MVNGYLTSTNAGITCFAGTPTSSSALTNNIADGECQFRRGFSPYRIAYHWCVGAPVCYRYFRINPTSTPNISNVPCGRITG